MIYMYMRYADIGSHLIKVKAIYFLQIVLSTLRFINGKYFLISVGRSQSPPIHPLLNSSNHSKQENAF